MKYKIFWKVFLIALGGLIERLGWRDVKIGIDDVLLAANSKKD